MKQKLLEFFIRELPPAGRLGIIGLGSRGTELRDLAVSRGLDIMLCDPPRSLEDAAEIGESFFNLWGNGMGGCELTNLEMETFIPLDALVHADVIAILVPLTNSGRFPTKHMITSAFLAKCAPKMRFLCASSPEIFSPECRNDERIVFFP